MNNRHQYIKGDIIEVINTMGASVYYGYSEPRIGSRFIITDTGRDNGAVEGMEWNNPSIYINNERDGIILRFSNVILHKRSLINWIKYFILKIKTN